MKLINQLLIFIGILAVLKYVFGLPISIVGSLVLTVIVTFLFHLINRSTS